MLSGLPVAEREMIDRLSGRRNCGRHTRGNRCDHDAEPALRTTLWLYLYPHLNRDAVGKYDNRHADIPRRCKRLDYAHKAIGTGCIRVDRRQRAIIQVPVRVPIERGKSTPATHPMGYARYYD